MSPHDVLSSSPPPGAEANGIDSFPPLTEEPSPISPPPKDFPPPQKESRPSAGETTREEPDDLCDKLLRDMQTNNKLHALNPYKQALTLSDIDSMVLLENACFPPEQACSRDKFVYRITKTSPFCVGLFTTVPSSSDAHANFLTYPTSQLAESNDERRSVLIAHIIVTLSDNQTVADDDMALPPDWEKPIPIEAPHLGHKPGGRTVALHSLAVLPELQGRHVGTTLLKGYIQMVKDSKIADRISLLTYERLVPWYEKFGFICIGRSEATYGGEEWYDLVYEFGDEDSDDYSEEDLI